MSKPQIEVWTCGHEAGAMCAECYRDLARRSGELAEEGRLLREQLIDLAGENQRLRDELDAAKERQT